MDKVVTRIRRNSRLNNLSDALLLSLLANSECIPEKIASGVHCKCFSYISQIFVLF